MGNVLIEVKHANKSFGATKALKDINLTIEEGEIHSLLGRNGAGKSTVVNIIAGIYPQDDGEVIYEGKDIRHLSVFERQKQGIRLVTQHASIIPELSIGENIFMGLWPKKSNGMVDWQTLYRLAGKELKHHGLHCDPRAQVKTLSTIDMRKVNIVRAMYGGAKLVILDEPTTALSSEERDELFVFINELKAKGTAFIFISHYLDEVLKLSDEITVIRDGVSFLGTGDQEATEESLATLIAGEEVSLTEREKVLAENAEDVVLTSDHIYGKNLNDISLKLYKGQILGVVGFPGSGAREICRALFGLEKIEKGEITVFNQKTIIKSPSDALAKGIAYISHDRHAEGIVEQMNIIDNMILPIMKTRLLNKLKLIDRKKAIKNARFYCDLLKIKANGIEDKLSSLSGGNQQKVVVGKTLSTYPKILILDEPTVGIDIKSREEIIGIVNHLTKKEGLSVIYLTNDFDELTRIADRFIFFREGQLAGSLVNKNLTQEDVVNYRDALTQKGKNNNEK